MTGERYDECNQPSGRVGGQWRHAQQFDAADGGQPVRGRGRAAYGDEPANLFEQGAHGKSGMGQWWKRIVVCGDDFGMNAGIDAGMLRLAGLGRLSAISCLTQGSTFAAHAASLKSLDLDLGVHLNLTEALGHPDQAAVMPLRALIARAYTGRLDEAWIDDQLMRQFDVFEDILGRAPDYVDGHQHVHQLPGVLPRLLRLLEHRYGRQAPWLRHTAPGMQEGIPLRESAKARLIGALGADAVARVARRDGWRTNRRLLGVYGLQGGARRYAGLLQHWLNNARDGDLLMCHPALPGAGDALARQRAAEFEVLARPELGDWMRLNGVCVARPAAS
ncbi:ChbG/HpnK family deacetylase [Bordetella petrii]|nr:ChbG/HpnK family deacetylase [Bordetella petrii]